MNTAQVIDFINPTEALSWRGWLHWIIVGTTNMNAFGWANRGTQLTANTFLHAVFIFIENMTTMQTLRLFKFFVHLDGTFFVASKHSTT